MGRRGIRGLFDAGAPRGLESGPLGLVRSEPAQVAAASALLADPLVWWPALDEQRRIDPEGGGFGWTRAPGLGTLAPLGEARGSGGEPLILSVLRWADFNSRAAIHSTSKAMHFLAKPPIPAHEVNAVMWTAEFVGSALPSPPHPRTARGRTRPQRSGPPSAVTDINGNYSFPC